MFFLNPRDLSENLSPWSIRSKDDIYQFWSSLLHCCFCKEHNIVLSKAGFTFFIQLDQILYGFDFEFMKIPHLFDTMLMIVLRNISWNCSNKDSNSDRFCTRCAKFWFFVPAWFTCCHLDFCKLCVKVPCKALKRVTR